jgi:hypothetical protein
MIATSHPDRSSFQTQARLVDAGRAAVRDAFAGEWGELRRLDRMNATPICYRSEP